MMGGRKGGKVRMARGTLKAMPRGMKSRGMKRGRGRKAGRY